MKNARTIRQLIAATAAVFLGFAAGAATISYTETRTVSGDLALEEDTTIEVGSGAVVTYTGIISGDFKLTKTGAGELHLSAANSFGSARIEAGVLRANCNGSLGSGTITIAGSTTAQCRLDFGVMPAVATFSNDFVLESASSTEYRAVRFWTGADGKAVKFTGSWTANGNIYFAEWCNNRPQSATYYTFDCPFDAGTNLIQFGAASTVAWKGTITAGVFYALGGSGTAPASGNFSSDYLRGSHVFYGMLNVGELKPHYNGMSVCSKDIVGGVVNLCKAYNSDSAVRGNISFSADNKIAAFISAEQTSGDSGNLWATASGTVSLTVTGTPATVTRTCYIKFKEAASLTLDAFDDFKQRIIGRTHTMTGFLTVKKGTLSLEGATTFASVQAVKVAGGTLDCLTTSANCFATITNLTVGASCTLNFAATATTPIPDDRSMDLEIGTGATVTLAEPTTWHVRRFVVDGKCKAIDTWTTENCPALPANLTVISSMTDVEEVENIAWKGGADDFTAASNWGKTGEPLDFSGNKYVATFAAVDAVTREATISGPVSLHGLVFAGDNFGLRASGDTAALSLFEAGIAFADDQDENTAAHSYTNDVPMSFFGDAAINVPVNDMLYLGDITTTYGLDFTGKGTTYLNGDVQVDGVMRFKNGRTYLRGTIAAVGHAAQTYASDRYLRLDYSGSDMSSLKYSLVLDNGVIEKPIYATANDGAEPVLVTTAYSTNSITGDFRTSSPMASISVGTGSMLTLSGGASFGWSIRKTGAGTLVVTNKPFSNNSGVYAYDGLLRLDVAGNKVSNVMGTHGGRLETTVDNAFSCEVMKLEEGTADFKNTFQTVPQVMTVSANSTLTGEYGSALMVAKGPAKPVGGTNVSFQVNGGISLAMGGTGTLLLTDRVFASCGDLMATNGTLELAADASWRNGTNFTAKGMGTLKFSAANQVNSDFAVLHMEGEGKVDIPAGVTLRVHMAKVDGVCLTGGAYTCQEEGATGATPIPQLTGKGTLEVLATQHTVIGEAAVETVVITNGWVEANVPSGRTLNDDAANGFKYWKCYVLGLDPNEATSKPIIKGVQNADPNKLAFKLGNVTYNADSGVKATYRVEESTSLESGYEPVATANAGEVAEFDLPQNGTVHYYKAVISYSN